MEPVKLDREKLTRRLQQVGSAWSWPYDAIVLVMGKTSDDASEHKTQAMHHWLLGIEFPETAIVLLKSGRVIFFAGARKVEILRQVEGPEVVLLSRGPTAGANADEDALGPFLEALREGREKTTIGGLLKEKHIGPWAESFSQMLSSTESLEVVECREEISTMLGSKDTHELELVRKAAFFAQLTMKSIFAPRMEEILDKDLKQTNEDVVSYLEGELDSEVLMGQWKEKHDLDPGELEPFFFSLQSGSQFELKPGVNSDKSAIPMRGTYVMNLAMKYAEYSACIARTMLVDPEAKAKEAYALAVEVQDLVLQCLKPEALFSDVYKQARNLVQRKRPDFADGFVKNVGFVMGLEFKDPQLVINEKSDRKVLPSMVFCVSVGFQETAVLAPWAVWLCDTVFVLEAGDGGKPCKILTDGCTQKLSDYLYELDDPEQPGASLPPPQLPTMIGDPPAQRKGPEADKKSAAERKTKPPEKNKADRKSSSKSQHVQKENRREPTLPKEKRSSRTHAHERTEREMPKEQKPSINTNNILSGRRLRERNAQTKQELQEQSKMDEEQNVLRIKKLEELRARFAGTAPREDGDAASGQKKLSSCKAYISSNDFPKDLRANRVQVDMSAEALLVPMWGATVPFHVRTIKNLSMSIHEMHILLRVNFFIPGVGKSADDFPEINGRRVYCKELNLRGRSKDNFDSVIKQFKEVQRKARQRELEGDVMRAAVESSEAGGESGPLRPLRPPFPCLRDLNMRPTFGAGARRSVGTLEAHANGFRFVQKSSAGEKVEILYSKVKHAIFEPCDTRCLIVLMHLHLTEPMMVGKKKTKDVQFFSEVTEQTEDLSKRKTGAAHDPDEILEEQREREMKERLNQVFHDFAKKVQAIAGCPLEFDMPVKELQFTGVPFKSVVSLCPCKRALVALQEWPPLCIDLVDIDVVIFERFQMQLREFDMVFINKDYNQMPLRITTIPRNFINAIRAWLMGMKIVWYNCSMNMAWQNVMKEITRDPIDFVEKGGWDVWFVNPDDSDASQEKESSGESDQGSDFEGEDDDDDEESGSNFSGDVDESEVSEASESDVSEGLSWDELEKEAERSDKKRELAKRQPPQDGGQPKKRPRR